MKLVVDTNIVFSALINPNSIIGSVLLNYNDFIDFFSLSLIVAEIDKYHEKLKKYSKLESDELNEIKSYIINSITIINEEYINIKSWEKAYNLIQNIDEDDTPFLALSIDLNCLLWTGDLKLIKGISKIKPKLTLSTDELIKMITK